MAPTEETYLLANEDLKHKRSCSGALRVRIATCAISVAEGYDFGILNGALVLIQREMHMSTWEVGLLVGTAGFSAAVAAFASGSLADIFGRKVAIATGCAFLAAGNLLMALAWDYSTLLAGRAVAFCGVGLGLSVVTTYMSEVSPGRTRGFFTSLEEMFVSVGILLAFGTSAVLMETNGWRMMLGLGAVLPLLVMPWFLSPFLPESPRFLLSQGRREDGHAALIDILGPTEEVEKVIAAWDAEARSSTMSWPEAFRALGGERWRSARAGLGIAFMFNGSGAAVMVTAYSTYILTREAGVSNEEAVEMTTMMGFMKLATLFVTALYGLDNWGRRRLLLVGTAMQAVAFAYMSLVGLARPGVWWTLGSLCLLAISFSLGFGSVSFTYIGEVFDTQLRAKGVALCITLTRLGGGIIASSMPVAMSRYGFRSVCNAFVIVNVCFLIYIWAFCPETKQRSLEDLQAIFNQDSRDGEARSDCENRAA